ALLIEDLNRRVGFYKRKNAEIQERERILSQLTEDYSQRLERVGEEEKRIREDAHRDAQTVLAGANALVERVIAQIRKAQASKEVIKETHRALDTEVARIKQRLKTIAPRSKPRRGPLKIGDGVWVEKLQTDGEVVARVGSRGRYKVRVGNLTVEVEGADLKPSSTPAKKESKSAVGIDVGEVFADQAVNQIDLRGLLADEAIARLEMFLDRAMLAGLSTLLIIHGKGTGALRKRVGDFLKDFPGVKSHRLGAWNEGGDGVTVVELE
ncbi:YhbY family RNA-binding protein, partial [bacterium]|nr:YhbY family RNA-binding protein [bacterium]